MADPKQVAERAWREAIQQKTEELKELPNNLQNVHTPFNLCNTIISKLKEEIGDLNNKEFCVFNLEFIEVLCYDFGVSLEKIWFYTDCNEKAKICETSRYKGVNVMKQDFFEMLKDKKEQRKFDIVIGNPPYQDPNNKRTPLWQKFVKKSIQLCSNNGYVSFIHPPAWRKPNHELHDYLFGKQMKYLEIHDQKDGLKQFGCGTRYDWYILHNIPNTKPTIIIDEKGKSKKINISECNFISHVHLDILEKCLAKNNEEKCKVIYNQSLYETRKAWMTDKFKDNFIYPCIHATTAKGNIIWFSSKKEGMFGQKKVIMGNASPENGFYDKNGEYGMTQHVFGIMIKCDEDGLELEKILKTEVFKSIVRCLRWSGFEVDEMAFASFRYGFWKELI